MPPVLFVVLAAIWLVAWFIVRRRIMRAMLERRLSVGRGAAALGLMWALVPLFALPWRPDLLLVVIGVSVVVFAAFAGVTLFFFRAMGRGPFV